MSETREFLENLELVVRRTAARYEENSVDSRLWLHLADEINKALKELPSESRLGRSS